MSNYDVYIVIGVILCGLAMPSFFGALAERRSPRASLFVMIVGASLIFFTHSQRPAQYDLREVPHAFVRVLAYLIR
ncbi:hypothetical protein [Anianabacter salinae]|uniref:hypothetical protein n=1 Tax=Anianabacter salinae TaxID=2851023 RepID=UPI00225DF686|nr:hypothetical protein [Anianabacter salinae]MBV0910826.1 hypothetical protein [Anianabacter salinae]